MSEVAGSDVFVRANPQPVVVSVSPAALSRDATTPVTVTGTGFVTGAIPGVLGGGVTVTNISLVGPSQITADVTVNAGATVGTRNVLVGLPGTGARAGLTDAWCLCADCVTVT